ncbi:MAG: cobyric acid synthase [Acidimicrobiales bacterium]
MRGGLMVCGTTSDAGKSHVTAGLCRLLARRGTKVAPFKAQNMALNSFVTLTGHEIGRAQAAQARAAGVEPEVAMNPILLKPTSDRTSQVVVRGEPWAHLSAAEYHAAKPELLRLVLEDLADLRSRFDVVVCEGAGSPTEINLLDHDIVNLRVAQEAGLPAVVVGDIDRGGVFAALYGTVALLPERYRALVKGFLINKLRGDPALLLDGCAQLEAACGVPTLGVLPWLADLGLDAEDSLALDGPRPAPAGLARGDSLDVAVVRVPRIANVTDVDALAIEPGVGVRLIDDPAALGDPDLVILPGSKSTVADLAWLRARGFDRALARLVERDEPGLLLGICGGYQQLGRTIVDDGVEAAAAGAVEGLGLLDVTTRFESTKVVRRRRGVVMGQPVEGYEIHHGRVARGAGTPAWVHLDDAAGDEEEGAVEPERAAVVGTSLHGLFEGDGFRATFLTEVGRRRGKAFVPAGTSFAAARERQADRLADLLEAHVDLDRLLTLIESGAPL